MYLKRSSFSIIIVFLCLSIIGIILMPLLTIRLIPSQNLPVISVGFSMYGQAPRIIEEQVTTHIESMLNRINGVQDIRSTSANGYGNVQINIDKNADMDAVRFEVATAIRQLWMQLPRGVTYPSIYAGFTNEGEDVPLLTFTLNAPSEPYLIYQYAEKFIKPALSTVSGLNRIKISGATPVEWQLEYDNEQLNRLNITVADIQTAILQSLNVEYLGMGNYTEGNNQKNKYISLVCRADNQQPFDPATILVKKANGKLIYLDQLVKTTYHEQEPQSYYRINGLNSIYITLSAKSNANLLKTGKRSKDILAGLQKNLPIGYELHKSNDATVYIRSEIEKIVIRSVLALIVLLLFILLISKNLRFLLLITISLVCNVFIAIIIYYLLGVELQVYSLAGIAISLTLIVNNIIIASYHILIRKNLIIFTAVLGAVLSTMAVLIIVFLLDDHNLRSNMKDFAYVLFINLSISFFIVLFLVPALMDKLRIVHLSFFNVQYSWIFSKRIVFFHRVYKKILDFVLHHRLLFILIVVLSFGTPVFLLPPTMTGNSKFSNVYNKTLGSNFYNQTLRKYVDIVLGGTWRLFNQRSVRNAALTVKQETQLYLIASMPNGATLKEMNATIQQMEVFISGYEGVKQFQTSIPNAQNASISISFTKEGEKGGVPYAMKSDIISKALSIGNASWNVYGLGDGFSNDMKEEAGSYRVSMMGYNYDELIAYAEDFKKLLLSHQRIKEVLILPEITYFKDNYQEFIVKTNQEALIRNNINIWNLYSSIHPIFAKNTFVTNTLNDNGVSEAIYLRSKQSTEYDIWSLNQYSHNISERVVKLDEISLVAKEQLPQKINKLNQQYQLVLQYEYIGPFEQGKRMLSKDVATFIKKLPIGYFMKIENSYWTWNNQKGSYSLIAIVVLIIYFICSILFNSFLLPMAVILTIPITYIGVFCSFTLFEIPFGQGGFAALVLLSGLSVSLTIYLIAEYSQLCYERKLNGINMYIKSLNHNIVPILLAVFSSILGFSSLLIGMDDVLWSSLALGTIGGLIFLVFAIFIYLPLFLSYKKGNDQFIDR